jgi:hypothetical protein
MNKTKNSKSTLHISAVFFRLRNYSPVALENMASLRKDCLSNFATNDQNKFITCERNGKKCGR